MFPILASAAASLGTSLVPEPLEKNNEPRNARHWTFGARCRVETQQKHKTATAGPQPAPKGSRQRCRFGLVRGLPLPLWAKRSAKQGGAIRPPFSASLGGAQATGGPANASFIHLSAHKAMWTNNSLLIWKARLAGSTHWGTARTLERTDSQRKPRTAIRPGGRQTTGTLRPPVEAPAEQPKPSPRHVARNGVAERAAQNDAWIRNASPAKVPIWFVRGLTLPF